MTEDTGSSGVKKRPSVAVIIPYYNGSDFIERSARSVMSQTIPADEFVVVDDGSSQSETEKLAQISARLGFRVIHKENGGQGSARNTGASSTQSEYICFLDQDDFFLDNHIQTLTQNIPLDDPHFGWVYGELFEADRDGQIVRTSVVSHHSEHPKTSIFDLLDHDMHVLPSASLISRKAFEAVGGFDEQFMGYEDDDLFLRIFRKGYTNHFIKKAVTVWCIHTESTSYGIRMARSRLRYFNKLTKMFPDEPSKDRYYFRDLIIKRFHNNIMSEAIAACGNVPGKFTTYREEYIQIATEYIGTILQNPNVSLSFKRKLALRAWIFNHSILRYIYRFSPVIKSVRGRFR